MEAHTHSNMHVLSGLESPGRHSTDATSTGAHTFHISPRSQAAGASILESPPSGSNAKQGWRKWLSRVTVLGLQPTPELVAIAMVYFVQGSLGLAALACSYFYKDDLKVEPAQAAILIGLQDLPWWIKPIYGFLSDSIPLCGYRRRSYLVACGAVAACCWALLAAAPQSTFSATALMTLASGATAFSDVVVDSIVVERSRGAPTETSGSLQSLCWVSNYVGQIASAYFSGFLVDKYGNRFVFALTAVFPVLVSCSSLLVTEQPVARRSRAPGHTSHTFIAAGHTLSATSSSTRYAPVASSDEPPTKPLLTNGAIDSSHASSAQPELRGTNASSHPGPNGHPSNPSAGSTAHPSGLAGAASVRAAGGVESGRQASPSHPRGPSRLPTSTAAVSPSSLERGLRGAFPPPSSSPSSPSPSSSVLCSSPECLHGGAWDGDAPLAVRLGRQARSLWGALSQRHILLPMAFIFLWQATPTANTAMFYFYSNHLHFSPEFLGWVALAGSCAGLAGVLLYNACLKNVPLKRMVLCCVVLGALLSSTQLVLVSGLNRSLGMSDELFVLGDSVVIAALVNIASMPVLVLAARLCPEGVEATLFASLMSILNAGSSVGSALGAALTSLLGITSTNFDRMTLLVGLCSGLALLPLPLLRLLPHDLPPPEPQGQGGALTRAPGEGASVGSWPESEGVEVWTNGDHASEEGRKPAGLQGLGLTVRRAGATHGARDTEMVQHELEARGLLQGEEDAQ